MTSFSSGRRDLFKVTAGSALAAPFILSGAVHAQEQQAETSMKPTPAQTSGFNIGAFKVTVISDGTRLFGNPHETYGTNQPKEAVEELLHANFLPTDKFLNGFSPTVVETGSDVVLFDTGMGEGGREAGAGHLLEGLKQAGYSPDQVSVVVLTHMHGDHIGGLMEGGAPAFKNARYVAGQVEYDFWKDPARVGTPAEGGHKGVVSKVVPLAEKTTFIKEGSEVVPGIVGVEAFGHSPGHMIFRVESEGKQLVLTADTANHFVLSLQKPDWEVRFDMDKAKAAASRRKVFDMIATERLPFVGYHMPFPAVGFVEVFDGGYRFVPETYQFQI
ncbi:glyoxylase-like metal-dependent hydrolase (beta-lactamase superfamily II) [Pararhizobium capsulatum DSM 1112]|uniref:Glyoxylase-like metal-dependent hydrolase (Beta-lactamase superfamily II) n=1 Tax=Pararhizobium capsulatum DSM 1112 TaxID=1121113 RepID=A0ABU0BM08_9HYPH|nr:MBL fold metallo-hydrolase [Pararhizobium capsulatum]MDQ0319272.1 glyoxylase-like metal-dependent hydrolase (beta-lactamase superfamily II) [Pararhizobium capsulatum DSM 1112]